MFDKFFVSLCHPATVPSPPSSVAFRVLASPAPTVARSHCFFLSFRLVNFHFFVQGEKPDQDLTEEFLQEKKTQAEVGLKPKDDVSR